MLFSKKTMVSVLALSTLLNAAPRIQAVEAPSLRQVLSGASALATFYLAGLHDTKCEKNLLKTLNLPAHYLQRTLNFATSKEGALAIGAGYLALTLGLHGKESHAYQLASHLLSAAKSQTPPPASN